MKEQDMLPGMEGDSLDDVIEARTLLDQLFDESRLYKGSKEYKALLDFVVRLRNFAPFNAMLLHVQKPGLLYAASALDWKTRFERAPKEGARPLLILWPFGPVALVYDVQDTEGKELPRDVDAFRAQGSIDAAKMELFMVLLAKQWIDLKYVDEGDGKAGRIRVAEKAKSRDDRTRYAVLLNQNHRAPVQFNTLAHELGHLFLGHLGPDSALKVPERHLSNDEKTRAQREIEAESVAYLVCARNGVKSASETYLANYVSSSTTMDQVDLYQVMRAAGQVEGVLGLAAPTKFEKGRRGRRKG